MNFILVIISIFEAFKEAIAVREYGRFSSMEIPCGYRFAPTDEELISYYLARKLRGMDLPPNVFKEVDVYGYTPQQLEGKFTSIIYTHTYVTGMTITTLSEISLL